MLSAMAALLAQELLYRTVRASSEGGHCMMGYAGICSYNHQ